MGWDHRELLAIPSSKVSDFGGKVDLPLEKAPDHSMKSHGAAGPPLPTINQ